MNNFISQKFEFQKSIFSKLNNSLEHIIIKSLSVACYFMILGTFFVFPYNLINGASIFDSFITIILWLSAIIIQDSFGGIVFYSRYLNNQ